MIVEWYVLVLALVFLIPSLWVTGRDIWRSE